MNKPKAIKDWEDAVRAYGCVVTSETAVELHHVVGRKYKLEKVLIGPYFILPLCWRLHGVLSNDPRNVTHFRHRFTEEYGLQRDLFAKMCDDMAENGIMVPVPPEIAGLIAQTNY